MKKHLCCLMAVMISVATMAELPALKRVGDKWLLHIDGKPFIILGGQVMNSSSFDLERMESVWSRMEAFHLNTLITPVSWQAVEPVEGVKQVDVEITWDPPWGMDMMSDEARLELGFM